MFFFCIKCIKTYFNLVLCNFPYFIAISAIRVRIPLLIYFFYIFSHCFVTIAVDQENILGIVGTLGTRQIHSQNMMPAHCRTPHTDRRTLFRIVSPLVFVRNLEDTHRENLNRNSIQSELMLPSEY